jgi:hypothetical protein
MNNDTRNNDAQGGDDRRSIRALRLSPLRDDEKQSDASAERRMQQGMRRVSQPPMGYRDPNGERPLNIEKRVRSRWSWIHTAFSVGVVALVCLLAYPILFPKATITVQPRTEVLTFDTVTFTASKDGTSGARYSLSPVVLSDTASVAATQKKQVQEKARGMITVQNLALKTKQRLIKNTRFESTTGKIYRIRESIEVPGYTDVDGVKRAGTLDVEVFADEEGAAFNLKEGALTVPGLKDKDDLYAGITAKVSSPISGGSTGTRFVITDMERQSVAKSLDATLLEKARSKAREGLLDNVFVLTGGEAFTLRDLPDEQDGTNVVIGREITFNQMIFDTHDFAEYVRSVSSKTDLPDSPAQVVNTGALAITLVKKPNTTTSVFSNDPVSFTLAGKPQLVWSVDTEALKQSLAGVTREEINDILKKNSTIGAGTQVDIVPFWNTSVPSEGSITVTVENGK